MRFKCLVCNWVYDESVEKTSFESLPTDWRCPVCFAGQDSFELIDENNAGE